MEANNLMQSGQETSVSRKLPKLEKPLVCSICYHDIIGEDSVKDMMQCQFCSRAFHFECIEEQLVCGACDERVLWPKTGTEEYLDLLECVAPTFQTGDDLFVDLDGESLTIDYLDQHGFDTPIKVRNKEGLGLKVPHSEFSVDDVIRYCGPDLKVDVINVKEQADQQMSMFEFGEYFKHKGSVEEVFNLISLEFSDTQLIHLVKPPDIVRELSWVSTATHDHIKEELMYNLDLANTEFYPFGQPQVLRYCLISAQNSFTDFHIDFGGTSVWYHLLWGRKVFYMIEPTDKHLNAFEEWMNLDSRDRSHSCFVEKVDKCYRCEFSPGETIFIPAGWIHGVYTPEDSLVFGGNFLQYYGVPTSLKIYEMEQRLEIAEKFTFPDYELVNFIAAKNLCDQLISWKSVNKKPTVHQIRAIKEMLPRLKKWYDGNSRLRQDLRVTEEPIKVKKLFKTLERLTKKGNSNGSANSGAGTRNKDLKVKIFLKNDEFSDEDDSFYCPSKRSYKRKSTPESKVNRAASESGEEDIKVKQEPPSLTTEQHHTCTEDQEVAEDSSGGDEVGNISLKLNAKLIHTLPVQQQKPVKDHANSTSSGGSGTAKKKRSSPSKEKSDSASTADRSSATSGDKKAKKKVQQNTCNKGGGKHDGPTIDLNKLSSSATASADNSTSIIAHQTTEDSSCPGENSPWDSSLKISTPSSPASSKIFQSQNNVAPPPKKARKGCATPKQRLGKILNIKIR